MADGLSIAINGLIKVGIGVFLIVLTMVLAYSAYANSRSSLFSGVGESSFSNTVNTVNAINDAGANSLTLVPTGSNSWISATKPLTVAITGNTITTFATNTASAIPGNVQTLTYTLYGSASNTVTTTGGNFYNITSITLTGMTLGAAPSLSVKVTQDYAGATLNSHPWANTVNSITMTDTVSYPIISNYTTYGGGAANQFGSNIGLAIFAVIFATIILAVVSSLREASAGGESGSFL